VRVRAATQKEALPKFSPYTCYYFLLLCKPIAEEVKEVGTKEKSNEGEH
jgi:hypothetical protein